MSFLRKRAASKRGGDLGQAIRRIRRGLDLNQSEFAVLLSWPKNMVSQYESGTKLSAGRLVQLLRFAKDNIARSPILSALEKHGVLPSDLAPSAIGDISTPRSTEISVSQAQQEINV